MSKKKGVMFLCFLSIIILVSGGVLAWSWPWSSVGNVVNEDSCIDSDGGKDYYERGEISDSNGDIVFGDGCIEGDGFNDGWLRETYCDESGPHFFDYECKGGCEDGACIEDDSGSDSSCTDLGYRKAGYYCSEEGFVLQKNVDISCENNFECTSNICLSGECVSEGLIKKVLNWFKNLFA